MRRGPSTIRRLLAVQGRQPGWFWREMGLPHKEAFRRIEAGTQQPPPGYYERAAKLLGVTVEIVRPEEAAELVTATA